MKVMQKAASKRRTPRSELFSHSVHIEATFGSAFQRDVAMKNLDGILAVWKELVVAHHKNNLITIRHAGENETVAN